MTTVQVKYEDVIKLILQFLQQNKYDQSFHTLQKQSNISLNSVDKKKLQRLIMESEWDLILKQLNYLMPSEDTLFDLYELMIDDLIQCDRYTAASYLIKHLLSNNPIFQNNYKERILRLQYICQNNNKKALYKKAVTDLRKEQIVKRILKQTHQQVQKSRLLSLLSQSIQYQAKNSLIRPNIGLSLFQNKQKELQIENQQIIKNVQKIVKYSEETQISSLQISNKGQFIVLGGIDGLIEIYNPIDYNLHTGLAYQADDIMMYHDHAISALQFSETDEMLASADKSGHVKIWSMETGKLLRKFSYTSNLISCMTWGNDPSHFLVGYQGISLYGIRSCTILKQYNSQQSQYLLSIFVDKNQRLYAFSQSGIVKVFNYGTQQQINLHSLKMPIIRVCRVTDESSELLNFVVCTGKYIMCIGNHLEEEKKYSSTDGQYVNIACVGNYIYQCVLTYDKKYKLNVRDRKTQKIVHFVTLQSKIQVLLALKYRNLLVTYDEANNLSFWRP